ncbi:hypothetical protein [Leucobacter sp. NPDC077196]|uniref:hypothetical protein n=1 Tax=Leucobacter sp. NPDC077196 TaxID=3154959 RepID=UPI003441D603
MTPQEIIGLAGVVLLFLGTIATVLGTRGKTKTDAKTALDARIDEKISESLESAWSRIESLESRGKVLETSVKELEEKDRLKSSAFARILRAIAKQWPTDHGPDLDPSDITLIEDTIPPTWLRQRRHNQGDNP